MQIIEVQTEAELKRFIDLPWTIYQANPTWIPPLKQEIRDKLDPGKHPFYRHGWAAKFLAVDNGRDVGRILVADDPRYNEQNGTNTGCFGFFESINDFSVSNALFAHAAKVLKSRGRDHMFGPMEYSTNYECGTLIDGFEYPQRVMMPYNPPYYQSLYEKAEFSKNRDLYCWWFDRLSDPSQKWRPLLDRFSKRYGVTIRPFEMNDFENEVARCMSVYDTMRNQWWWSCVTLTKEEINYLAANLRLIANPGHIYIAEDNGKTVGFSVTIPDVNEAIKPLNGTLSWCGIPYLGVPRLMWRLRRVRNARVAILCVLPEYQRRGVGERLILQTIDYGINVLDYTGAELGWTDELNDKVNKVIARVGGKRYKTYRVYEKEL
ncbi:MAG: GNAT family N-acetyltransferase [Thermoguttaceae bacterium]|nr:GNAT family N-acetyltransferase [Thermoguttaceae bacterium]